MNSDALTRPTRSAGYAGLPVGPPKSGMVWPESSELDTKKKSEKKRVIKASPLDQHRLF